MNIRTAILLLPACLNARGAEITVAPAPFSVSHTLPVTGLPARPEAVALPAEAWKDFEIVEIAPQASKVAAGATLVGFDTEEIDKFLVDFRRGLASAEIKLAQAGADLATLEKTTPLKLDAARRTARNAREELDYFKNTRRKALEEGAERSLIRAQSNLADAKEELRQLQKMYDADDVTEETEEIILTRQKLAVEQAEYALRMEQFAHDRTLKVSLPRQAELYEAADKDASIALADAEATLPRQLKSAQIAFEGTKTGFQRDKANLAKLEADRKLFTIKAPSDGWFYYGTMEDGRWNHGADILKLLVVSGKAPVKRPFATFIPASAALEMTAPLEEATARSLATGMTGTATLTGLDQTAIPATLTAVSPAPDTDGRYRANFRLDWPKGLSVPPGATAFVNLVSYQKNDALAVPTKALKYTPAGWTVQVKLADGKSEQRVVSRGHVSKDQTEILSGLEPGQVVLVP